MMIQESDFEVEFMYIGKAEVIVSGGLLAEKDEEYFKSEDVRLFKCLVCGSLVTDTRIHLIWHDERISDEKV